MECKQTKNLKQCTCTYSSCPRQGLCCECVSYHLKAGVPGCFSADAERTYDRSFAHFARLVAAADTVIPVGPAVSFRFWRSKTQERRHSHDC